MTTPEDLLRDTLRDRADQFAPPRTPMSDVISTAGALRRRRRLIITITAVTAVVAVAAPTAVLIDRDPAAAPAPGTNGPSPTPTESRSDSALAHLPTGAAPSLGYVADHVYISPDGSRFGLPADRGISAVTPYHGGFLVADTRVFEGSVGLAFVDETGKRVEEWCSSGAPAVSADRLDTAWVTFPCLESGQSGQRLVHRGISTGKGEGETTQSVGDRSPISVAGFLGQDVVVDGAFGEQAYLTDLVSKPRPIAELSSVGSVDEASGLVAGQLGFGGEDGAVLDPRTGDLRWQAPGVYLGEFSPDGSLIVGQDIYGWAAFDRSGSKTYELDIPDGEWWLTGGLAWEDNTHLLAGVATESQTAIVRFGPDGVAELAAPPVPYDVNDPAYVLAVRP